MTETVTNTDREIWRETEGDYYAPSIHATELGGIGINVGGMVHVLPVREWHKLALRQSGTRIEGGGERYPTADREYEDIDDPRKTGLADLMEPESPTPEHVEGDVLSVGEMDVVAWRYRPTHVPATAPWAYMDDRRPSASFTADALVLRSQAQSALAAMRAERDALARHSLKAGNDAARMAIELKRLTEENEALRKGKTDIALTALAADGQAQEAYEKLCAAEARIKALEEAGNDLQPPRRR